MTAKSTAIISDITASTNDLTLATLALLIKVTATCLSAVLYDKNPKVIYRFVALTQVQQFTFK